MNHKPAGVILLSYKQALRVPKFPDCSRKNYDMNGLKTTSFGFELDALFFGGTHWLQILHFSNVDSTIAWVSRLP